LKKATLGPVPLPPQLDMNLNPVYYYLLANGLILLLLNTFKFKRGPAMKYYLLQYLILLLLAFEFIWMEDLFQRLPFFCYPDLPVRFLLAPFIYLYVRTYTHPAYKPSRATLSLLFLPAVAELVAFGIFCVYYHLHPHTAAQRGILANTSAYYYIRTTLALSFNLWLIIRSYARVQRFSWNLLKIWSNLKTLRFGWLKTILAFAIGLWLFWLLTFAVECIVGFKPIVYTLYYILYSAIALITLVFGYFALLKPYMPELYAKARQNIAATEAPPVAPANPSATEGPAPTGTPAAAENLHLATCFAELDAYMQSTAAFQNPNITLAEIGKTLNTSSFTLSKAIKACSKEGSFYEYINKMRLLHFLRSLPLPNNQPYTLAHLGQKAGFSSFTTLTKYCKKYTGHTPSKAKQLMQNGQSVESLVAKL
jgi:AraC-like DNA-binding protein